MTKIADPEKRFCTVHNANCELPPTIFALGAGFSCTSYSGLNQNAKGTVGAMKEGDSCQSERRRQVGSYRYGWNHWLSLLSLNSARQYVTCGVLCELSQPRTLLLKLLPSPLSTAFWMLWSIADRRLRCWRMLRISIVLMTICAPAALSNLRVKCQMKVVCFTS